MRCMSVCLVCYNMCFVFIADNRRPLEGRKQQPLILCAGQAFLHSRVWSIHSPRAGSTGVVIHHSGHCICTHAHTHKDVFVLAVTSKWTQGPSGNQSFLITRQRIHKQIHARTEAANTTAYRAKGTNAFNEAISLPQAAHERVGVYFSIKSFIMYPANQTLISLSHCAEGNKDLLHQPRQHGPHTQHSKHTNTQTAGTK